MKFKNMKNNIMLKLILLIVIGYFLLICGNIFYSVNNNKKLDKITNSIENVEDILLNLDKIYDTQNY